MFGYPCAHGAHEARNVPWPTVDVRAQRWATPLHRSLQSYPIAASFNFVRAAMRRAMKESPSAP
jgi:hypothetical protein